MQRFELKLLKDQRDGLQTLADRTGVSASDWARLAIDRLLEDQRHSTSSSRETAA